MKKLLRTLGLAGLLCVSTAVAVAFWAEAPENDRRAAAAKKLTEGNFNDAYQAYRELALDAKSDARQVPVDLTQAVGSLNRLGRVDEIDEFIEAVIKTHAGNWRLLQQAAITYQTIQHDGFIVAGKFYRGHKRGGGEYVNAFERDRVRSLQLWEQAAGKIKDEPNSADRGQFFFSFAGTLIGNRGYNESWRFQYLSDLKELPDYDKGYAQRGYGRGGYGGYGGDVRAAPVDEEGKPIYYRAAKRWEDAQNDGERWRWALEQSAEHHSSFKNKARLVFAGFLHNQFGVGTMAQYGTPPSTDETEDTKTGKKKPGPFELHTLADDETIARLANGVKRWTLPDEFSFVKIYKQIADDGKSTEGEQSLNALAGIFSDRRQYPRSVEYWKRSVKEYGPGQDNYKQKQIEQITGNWGRFENINTQAAGQGGTVEFIFRNGKAVAFEAFEVKADLLLNDVKAYLKTKPAPVQWQTINIQDIGSRIVAQGQEKYVGKKVANWDLKLEPRPEHFDRRITVTTPLRDAGAYLLVGKMADGNTSRILMWVADTTIVKKPLNTHSFHFVADAVTGQPIAKANVEFFGYRQRYTGKDNKYETDFLNFSEFTDANGQILTDESKTPRDYQWVITARTDKGRFAYLGFTNTYWGNYYDAAYNATKVFTITDRPVYRPSQKVRFKFWIRHAKYDQPDVSDFADRDFPVEIHNPKGEKILAKTYHSDAYGGIEGELDLPADATLGVYGVYVVNLGGGQFRVEEYKKPEFEVSVEAPTEPVMLGEKIAANVKAKYLFGAPVTQAKAKYKVTRTAHSETWYPGDRWDWLYGRGYWWFAYEHHWYPGFHEWGCKRPGPWWVGRGYQPPEVVADAEAQLGEDGTFQINIDTAVAKAIHGDKDHQYSITVEVTDQSRRTIVGSGKVLVARKPFKVTTWVDRGYFRIGDVVKFHGMAQTIAGKPVKGAGELRVLKITYDKNFQPVETEVDKFQLDTTAEGAAEKTLKATAAGQYRLSYKVTDSKEHVIEGGYLFTVMGEDFDGRSVRFNDLEVIPEKKEYAAGEKARVQINTNRTGSTVLLFVRPSNGIYLAPKLIKLDGKSTVEEFEITKKDMPNFFVEAVTVAGAKVYTEAKEIIVPPEQRVLNVIVQPSAPTYKPGEKSTVKVKLTDVDGKAFVGSTVLSIYDKAVEYISGGSNVQEIKAFFWKWRRSHHPRTESSLERMTYNLLKPNEIGMSALGAFGHLVADEFAAYGNQMAESETRQFSARGLAKGAAPGGGAAPATPMAALGGRLREEAKSADRDGAFDAQAKRKDSAEKGDSNGLGGPGGGDVPNIEPNVRTKFADTALWVGSLTTDKEGLAEVSLDMPENLTTWKVKVWGMGHGTKVGQGEAEVITRKDLIVRLQAPRFFVEKDEVVLSANVHNYLKDKKTVRVVLESDGKTLKNLTAADQTVTVAANGEQRVDWRVKVLQEGEAIIRVKALTNEESDALEMKFPVFVHGMLKTDSFSGALRPKDTTGKITLKVPKERRIQQSRLELRYSPSLAGAMVDALPYLADYPYGCTEQTLNRFVPTVVTQKILQGMGLDLKAIGEKRTNLNAQEIGDDKERAKQWQRFERNAVFDNEEVTKMVKSGVQRLTEMQLSDGGWGWFSGYGEHSSAHTTAVVVHGLQVAKANDVPLVPGLLERGVAWLTNYQNQQVELLKNGEVKPEPKKPYKTQADNLDALVHMVLVDADVKHDAMKDYLYRDRVQLAVYAKAVYGLALHKLGDKEKLEMIMKNISQFVVNDDENQTVHLKLPENNYWWYWYGSEIEAHSYYLKLLAKTDPKGEVAPRLVKYLLNNRKHATYWNSTRDTALAIEALADYLKASGESKPDLSLEVYVNGKKRKEVKITPDELFTFDNKFVLEGDGVEDGEQVLEIRKKGDSPLYYNAYLTNFTLEDHITKAGLEVKVQRQIYKLQPVDKKIKVSGSRGQAVDQKVEKYERILLKELDTLKSGELVEVELEIDSKNDYEYLIFEDMKAAGFEPVDTRSGYNGNSLGAYMELRDNRVSFFVRALARGKHSVSYRLRAEIPGQFSALPARAEAMYAPELKGNSDEIKLKIVD